MIDNIPIAPIIILDDVVGVVGGVVGGVGVSVGVVGVGVVVSPLMLFLVGVEGSGVSAVVDAGGREAKAIVTLFIYSLLYKQSDCFENTCCCWS